MSNNKRKRINRNKTKVIYKANTKKINMLTDMKIKLNDKNTLDSIDSIIDIKEKFEKILTELLKERDNLCDAIKEAKRKDLKFTSNSEVIALFPLKHYINQEKEVEKYFKEVADKLLNYNKL